MSHRFERSTVARLLLCALPFAVLAGGALACGGGGAGVDVPALQVTTATIGPEPDPDGYTLSIDGGAARTIGLNDTLIVDQLAEGEHSILLDGLAANCVADGTSRTVTVSRDATAQVGFAVACSATSGALRVAVATSGEQPDSDGYTLTVEGLAPRPVGADTTLVLTGVPVGPRTVGLDGLAPNCAVDGANPVSVSVPGGDTAAVAFAVKCSSTTGRLVVKATTTGASPDPNGYTVAVDGGTPQTVGVNDSLTLGALTPGPHSVRLAGLASNCRLTGSNPRSVTVTAGASARIEFAVDCPTPRVARWTPQPSGTSLTLVDVGGNGPSDVYAVGQFEGAGERSTIVHYNGTAWSPQFNQDDLRLEAVWGSGTTDLYAVGFDGDASADGAILHSAGTGQWGPVRGPAVPPGTAVFLHSVWGSSASDVYAVGVEEPPGQFDLGLIAHFDGTTWSAVDFPGADFLELADVWGSGPRDVYAVGLVIPPFDDVDPSAVILHYDGTGWETVFRQDNLNLTAIWGSGPNDVYAVGLKGVVLHWDGANWLPVATPSPDDLFGSWVGSSSDVFAVGRRGTILRSNPPGTALVREMPTSSLLFGVWGSSPIDVFAVGRGGTILHGTP